MRHKITITLDVESDCTDLDLLRVAVASTLADFSDDYECTEHGTDTTVRASFRISAVEWGGGPAEGGGRVDAGFTDAGDSP